MRLIKYAHSVTHREPGAYAPKPAPRTQAGLERDFEVVLHVGHLKTATTWVQENIFENPRSGFVVPWTDARAARSLHSLRSIPIARKQSGLGAFLRRSWSAWPTTPACR